MAAYKYSYGNMSSLFKNSAEVAGEVCKRLAESEEGLTPKTLVEASRARTAPLHNEFEWNDDIAAEKYREEQAASIIRHLIIVRVDQEEPKHYKDRSFVFTGSQKTGYVPLNKALTNEVWRSKLLEAAKRDMQIFIAKYRRLKELSKIIDDMNQILGEDETE